MPHCAFRSSLERTEGVFFARVVLMKTRRDERAATDAMTQLEADLARVRSDPALSTRTARLVAAGIPQMAKKVAEEAAEVAIDAVRQNRQAVVSETADLLYHLVVLLSELKIDVADVWTEMEARRRTLGLAEKLPKTIALPPSGSPRRVGVVRAKSERAKGVKVPG
jgi:phosphoribosyl-ATP pyrophosphohydrolase